jgi:hypothetical protein
VINHEAFTNRFEAGCHVLLEQVYCFDVNRRRRRRFKERRAGPQVDDTSVVFDVLKQFFERTK